MRIFVVAMAIQQDMGRQRSVYNQGAADALYAGAAMAACFVAMLASATMPLMSVVALGLFLATPFLVWRLLRRAWINGWTPVQYSAVWLHGILTFMLGGVLLALVMYVSLKYVCPGWMEDQLLTAAGRLASEGQSDQAAEIQRIVTSGAMPSAIYTAFSSIWFVAFTGSLWSMIFAAILTKSRKYINLRLHNIENGNQQ